MTDWDIDSGQPLKHDADDRLHFVPLARKLAPLVLAKGRQDCLVVGLYAPWGHGKSSLLNLVENALPGVEDGPVPIIVRFNPWLYSSTESLLYSFFGSIAEAIGASSIRDKALKAKTAQKVRDLGKVAGPLLTTAAQLPPGAGGALINTAAALLEGGESTLEKAKKDAGDALLELFRRKKPARLVVLIDDLDRAEPAEVRAMLRLVRLVADLPNTTYVLAMDNLRVGAALARDEGEDGQRFLEKIVNVPVHLPPATETTIRVALREGLAARFERAGLGEPTFWSARGAVDGVFGRIIVPTIRSFRDLARYLNGVSVALAGEYRPSLHSDDAALLALVQVFRPDAYERLRFEGPFLTGHEEFAEMLARHRTREDARHARGARLAKIGLGARATTSMPPVNAWDEATWAGLDDRDRRLLRLLLFLFPYAVAPDAATESKRSEARRTNRVGVSERFDRYFRLAPKHGEMSDEQAEMLLAGLVRVGRTRDTSAAEALVAGTRLAITHPESEAAIAHAQDRVGVISRVDHVYLAEGFFAAGRVIGDEHLVAVIDSLLSWRGKTLPQRGQPDPEVFRSVEVARRLVEALGDPLTAVEVAAAYITKGIGGSELDASDGALLAVAGMARMDAFVRQGASPLTVEPASRGSNAVWRWRDLLRAAGHPNTQIEVHLRELLARKPEHAWRGIALGAGWGNAPFLDSTMTDPKDVLRSIDSIVGVEFLANLLAELGDRVIDPHGLVQPFLEMVRDRWPLAPSGNGAP